MKQSDRVLIVGGGLAGSCVARTLERRGVECLVFDNLEPFGASRASCNMFSEGWSNILGEDFVKEAIKAVEELVPCFKIDFWDGKKVAPMFHVSAQDILVKNNIRKNVKMVNNGSLVTDDGERYEGTVVVAAGVWSRTLLKADLTTLTGHSILYGAGLPEARPIMKMWAPFRHVQIFEQSPGVVWFGDSTALKETNYNAEVHVPASLHRASGFGLSMGAALKVQHGHRPIVKGLKNGLYKRLSDKLFVLSGGWKCGTLIYPRLALELARDMGLQ